jgi:hypothetical protein
MIYDVHGELQRFAHETAVRLYPRDTIQYRDGARIIARSDRNGG